MVIGFKEQFVEPILDGTKLHTMREDTHNRWDKGRVMHMATGVRTTNYNQFNEEICNGTQKVEIKWSTHNKNWVSEYRGVQVFIDGVNVTNHTFGVFDEMLVEVLARNDGFATVKDFFEWFSEDYTGKIIHWTELRY
jgi:hypothetical protein